VKAIPLVRAKFVIAVVRAAERQGVRAVDLVDKVGIPQGVLDWPDSLIPSWYFHEILGWAVRMAGGTPGLGRDTLNNVISREPDIFARLIQSASTLGEALESFQNNVCSEYAPMDLRIEQRDGAVLVAAPAAYAGNFASAAVELCEVTLMCKVVQAVLGRAWVPREVWLQAQADRRIEELDLLAESLVRFGAPSTGIVISQSLLTSPVAPGSQRPAPATLPAPPSTFPESLREVIISCFPEGAVRIETVAKVVRLSVRTLQRKLADYGLTFSRLADHARFQFASRMLSAEGAKIIDVAFAVGYSDHAHFSRAFRRIAGVTPSRFRQSSVDDTDTGRWLQDPAAYRAGANENAPDQEAAVA